MAHPDAKGRGTLDFEQPSEARTLESIVGTEATAVDGQLVADEAAVDGSDRPAEERFAFKWASFHILEKDGAQVKQAVSCYSNEQMMPEIRTLLERVVTNVWTLPENQSKVVPAYWQGETGVVKSVYEAIIENPEQYEIEIEKAGRHYLNSAAKASRSEAFIATLFTAYGANHDTLAIIKVDVKDATGLVFKEFETAALEKFVKENAVSEVVSKAALIPHPSGVGGYHLKVLDEKSAQVAQYFWTFLQATPTVTVDVKLQAFVDILPIVEQQVEALDIIDHVRILQALGTRGAALMSGDVIDLIEEELGIDLNDVTRVAIIQTLDKNPEKPFKMELAELSTIAGGSTSVKLKGALAGVTISGPTEKVLMLLDENDDDNTKLVVNKVYSPYVLEPKPQRPPRRRRAPRPRRPDK